MRFGLWCCLPTSTCTVWFLAEITTGWKNTVSVNNKHRELKGKSVYFLLSHWKGYRTHEAARLRFFCCCFFWRCLKVVVEKLRLRATGFIIKDKFPLPAPSESDTTPNNGEETPHAGLPPPENKIQRRGRAASVQRKKKKTENFHDLICKFTWKKVRFVRKTFWKFFWG